MERVREPLLGLAVLGVRAREGCAARWLLGRRETTRANSLPSVSLGGHGPGAPGAREAGWQATRGPHVVPQPSCRRVSGKSGVMHASPRLASRRSVLAT